MEHVANVKLYAEKNDYDVSVGGDLVAVGLANCLGACFGSLVCASGFSRTALNERAKSQLSLLISVFVTFGVVLVVAPLLTQLPLAILNVILFCAVAPLLDYKAVVALVRLRRHGLADLFALVLAFVCTCVFGVVTGMILAIAFSIVEFIRKSSRPQVSVLERTPGSLNYEVSRRKRSHHKRRTSKKNKPGKKSLVGTALDLEEKMEDMAENAVDMLFGNEPQHHAGSPTIVLRFEAPMWFANAGIFMDRVMSEARDPSLRAIILDLSMVPWADSTAANTVKKVLEQLKHQGVTVYFADANSELKFVLQRVCSIPEDHFYHNIFAAECSFASGKTVLEDATPAHSEMRDAGTIKVMPAPSEMRNCKSSASGLVAFVEPSRKVAPLNPKCKDEIIADEVTPIEVL